MKRLLSIIAIFLALCSCSVEDRYADGESEGLPENGSHFVPYEQVEQELSVLLAELDRPSTKGMGKRKIKEHFLVGAGIATKGADGTTSEASVYIINFENEAGFAIMSADDRVPSVLAITESGSLRPGQEIDNPGLAAFLVNAEEYIRNEIAQSDKNADQETPRTRIDIPINPVPSGTRFETHTIEKVEPLLRTHWGQEWPYNEKLPKINSTIKPVAGCVLTAVAQIVAYHQYPKNYKNRDYQWDKILKHKITFNEGDNCCTDIEHSMLGLLFKWVGEDCNMIYGQYASSTDRRNGSVALLNMGYNHPTGYVLYDYNLICQSLRNKLPVYTVGYAIKVQHKALGMVIKNTYEQGHAWVIDGFWQYYTLGINYYGDKILSTDRYDYDLVHCNFGWDGQCDGYYKTGVFNTNKPPVVTKGENREGEAGFFQYRLEIAPNVSVPRS